MAVEATVIILLPSSDMHRDSPNLHKANKEPNIIISISINRPNRIKNYLLLFTVNCDVGLFSSALSSPPSLTRLAGAGSGMNKLDLCGIRFQFAHTYVQVHMTKTGVSASYKPFETLCRIRSEKVLHFALCFFRSISITLEV